MAGQPRGTDRLDAAETRTRVVQLRRLRLSFEEIGAQLGLSRQMAWKHYQRALADLPAPHIAEHRAEELTLVDDAIRRLMAIAASADQAVSPRTKVEAWTAIRGWAEHKARIIGLNAALKVEVSDAVDAEISRLAEELAAVEPGREGAAARDAEAGSLSEAPA